MSSLVPEKSTEPEVLASPFQAGKGLKAAWKDVGSRFVSGVSGAKEGGEIFYIAITRNLAILAAKIF